MNQSAALLPSMLEQQLVQLPTGDPAASDRAREALAAALGNVDLYKVMVDHLRAGYRSDAYAAAIAWRRSPLGRRLTQLEVQVGEPAHLADYGRFRTSLMRSPPSQRRLTLIRRLDQASLQTDMAVEHALSVQAINLEAMNQASPAAQRLSPSVIEGALEPLGRKIRPALKAEVETFGLYVYRDVSEAELELYVDYLESRHGSYVTRAGVRAVFAALQALNAETARIVRRRPGSTAQPHVVATPAQTTDIDAGARPAADGTEPPHSATRDQSLHDSAAGAHRMGRALADAGNATVAERLLLRALLLREQALGPDHPEVGDTLDSLVQLYLGSSRCSEANALATRSLAIRQNGVAEDKRALALNNVGSVHLCSGEYKEAKHFLRRALGMIEELPDTERWRLEGAVRVGLCDVSIQRGALHEAEQCLNDGLERAADEAATIDASSHGKLLLSLGELYRLEERYDEAARAYDAAVGYLRAQVESDHRDVAVALRGLAATQAALAKLDAAERNCGEALARSIKANDQHLTALVLKTLGDVFSLRGAYEDAETTYLQMVSILETHFPSHPDLGAGLATLGEAYLAAKKYPEATDALMRARDFYRDTLGSHHPNLVHLYATLAAINAASGKTAHAVRWMREAIYVHRGNSFVFEDAWQEGRYEQGHRSRDLYFAYVVLLNLLRLEHPKHTDRVVAETFETGQLRATTEASAALTQTAARFALGDEGSQRLAHERQETTRRWAAIDAALFEALSRPRENRSAGEEAGLRRERDAAREQLQRIDAAIARDFPDYGELAHPQPLPLAEAQALLRADEALLVYAVEEETSFLWAVTPTSASLHDLGVSQTALAQIVSRLRDALDQPDVYLWQHLAPYDVDAAHELYLDILAPAEADLRDARHVMVVADGPLQSLPFGVLVTDTPAEPAAKLEDYSRVDWLVKRHAVTTLPSVGALRALRRLAKESSGREPFIGFGDPLLGTTTAEYGGTDASTIFAGGAVADVNALREFSRLPDTADEMRTMAQRLGAPADRVYLGAVATERTVRSLDLSRARTLAFSTHALIVGEFEGLIEPGLILTPPVAPSRRDDGFLAASEVAQLNLNADWVILSACNTAASDGTPGARGLSGLARAFFYAGARTLLVSHWTVDSEATLALITELFHELDRASSPGRAEALRRAMLAVLNDRTRAEHSHPMYWAPFVVVGEGGTPTDSAELER